MRVRWKIFLYLFGYGFIAYFQARTISVAGERMMPELGITQLQLSWIETAFLVGYAGMQFPGGLLGQRIGARLMFALIGLTGFVATFATPLAPLLLAGTGLLAALCALQFLLGCSQGPIFPVSAGVFEAWFPSHQWPLAQGWQTMGLGLGAAATPPVISWLMVHYGWQHAILWTSPPVLLLVAAWWIYARNTPREHAAVGAAELVELEETGPDAGGAHGAASERHTSSARTIRFRVMGSPVGPLARSLIVAWVCTRVLVHVPQDQRSART